MILKKKEYKLLKKQKNLIIKIQRFVRKFLKKQRILFETYQKKSEKELETLKTEHLPIKKESLDTIVPTIPFKQQDIKRNNINKQEKIQKQKESIRNLYEPNMRKNNKTKSKLLNIQSHKALEENKVNIENRMVKNASIHKIIKENSVDNLQKDDSFTNNMEMTKKINNVIANSNTMMLSKIYGAEKKKEQHFMGKGYNEYKKNKINEDKHELFNFFQRKLGK